MQSVVTFRSLPKAAGLGRHWLLGVLLTIIAPLSSAAPPVLYFSDLDWGPKTGWEGSPVKGAAITVWGKNLGASRGGSYITVNGVRLTNDSDYAEWGVVGPARGLERITFWLNAACTDGPGSITVTVDGVTSNALPFTVAPGTIYFIAPDGSNSNNGLYATNRGAGSGPFRDLYMFNPGLDSMHSSANRNPSGDGQYIVYVRAGTYTTLDVDGAFIALRGPYGAPDKRKALVGYPGETPVLNAAAAQRGVVWAATYSPYGRLNYFTFAKLKVVNGTTAFELWGDYNRVVGNHMKDMLAEAWSGVVMVDNSQYTRIYGNFFDHNGFDSYKHNVYVKTHRDYISGDKSVDYTYIGWNEFANAYSGADRRGGVIFISRESGTTGKYTDHTYIHDNYFRDGDMDFIYIGDSVAIGDVYVYNNIFSGGTSINGGITLYDGTNNAYFYNNTFYQIGAPDQPMVWATGTARGYFKNNIWFSRPGQQFLMVESYRGATCQLERDLFYDADGSTALPSGAGISVSASFVGNPMFVNPVAGDFHLLAASPAVDAGVSAVSSLVTRDYDGNPRPVGSGYDIGALEFVTPGGISVSISPGAVTLGPGQSQQFTATVSGTGNTAVTWSMSPSVGTLSASGLYTAPAQILSSLVVTITATSVADPTRSASATVTLMPAVSVSISPSAVTLRAGQSQQFTATVTGASDTSVTWSRSPAIGTLTSTGLYRAPSSITSQQTVTVTATSVADPTRSASATVTLMPATNASGFTVSWVEISSTKVRVSWTAPTGRPSGDYIVLAGVNSPDWWYVWSAQTRGATAGSFDVDKPTRIGLWEFRYYLAGSTYQLAARSATLAIGTAQFSVVASATSVARGKKITVKWTAPAGRPTGWADTIGLYLSGAPNDRPVWYGYTRGATSGTFTVTAPSKAGVYQFRYVLDYGPVMAARSSNVTVR